MNLYGLSTGELIDAFSKNDQAVGSGDFDGSGGFIPVSISGKALSKEEMESIVVRSDKSSVVTMGDVAEISYGMSEDKTIFRVNGERAIYLLPKKRQGYNLIKAAAEVRDLVERERQVLPRNISLLISQDLGEENAKKFRGLSNTILASVILVMLLSLISLGTRAAILVGGAIPLSFLMCLAILYYAGWTINSMVLFALLVSSGLLVDMAVVVVEVSNRLMRDKGYGKVKAYKRRSKDYGKSCYSIKPHNSGGVYTSGFLAGGNRQVHGVLPPYHAGRAKLHPCSFPGVHTLPRWPVWRSEQGETFIKLHPSRACMGESRVLLCRVQQESLRCDFCFLWVFSIGSGVLCSTWKGDGAFSGSRYGNSRG